ncbi:hypothetical protein QVD17_16406 [Tagetes erecta]|uniref:Uncharacterized protein n=1 Tax=Tagetes erecta TaxID=13708 RepID=A0AAD8NZM0_TARER|nr:hypothetical protein QVD17_16406 [Tagetes erecta]
MITQNSTCVQRGYFRKLKNCVKPQDRNERRRNNRKIKFPQKRENNEDRFINAHLNSIPIPIPIPIPHQHKILFVSSNFSVSSLNFTKSRVSISTSNHSDPSHLVLLVDICTRIYVISKLTENGLSILT